MATMLRFDADEAMEAHISAPPRAAAQAATLPMWERSAYETGGFNGFAAIASAGAVALLISGLLWWHGPHHHHRHHHLRIVNVELAPPPPPVQPESKPHFSPVPPPPALAAPPPIVQTNAPVVMPAPVALTPPPPTPAPSNVAATAPAPPSPPAPAVADAGDLSSKMIAAKPPTYPLESRRKHEQGIVLLDVMLGADGRVADISVARSSGSDRLDHAALAAVRDWRWSPTVRDGQPVAVRGRVSIPFVLKA